MGFWITLILWAVSFALSELLRPDPDIENARPGSLDDFNFPTATEGRVIPLHWGTDRFAGPNVIWYGDLRAKPVTEKVKISFFKEEEVTVGHEYRIGFQMALCHGPAIIKTAYVGEEELTPYYTDPGGSYLHFREKALKGTLLIHTGSKTQAKDSYLDDHQNPCPAYRGLCYATWAGGYVGDSTTIKPWSFEVERIPTGLGGGDHRVNSKDANPLHVAYEIFTDTGWGYGFPSSDIDVADFQAAAATVKAEGNGMSLTLTNQKDAKQIIKEIEKQIDGYFRIDPATGKWKCVLVRDGYSLVGLKTADPTNVKEMIEYSRGGWEGTTNVVRIAYKRRANMYTDGYAQAQDAANMKIQGRKMPVVFSYPGVRDDALANKIAWREIRTSSYPLAKLRMEVNRDFWDSFIGEVFLLTWDFQDFSVADLPFRITRVDGGSTEEPRILIDAVQDIFSWRAASFADQDPSQWVTPDRELIPFPTLEQIAFESPYAFDTREETLAEGRVWVGGESQGRKESGYEILQRNGSGTPTGDFYTAGTITGFVESGTLDGAIDNDDTTIDVLTDLPVGEIVVATNTDTGEYLYNLFLIGDEFIACTGATEITGGLQLTGCLRGFLDTAQANHADTDKVWLIHTGGGLTLPAFDPSYNVDLKLLPYDQVGNKVSDVDVGVTTIQLDLDYRERRPYPPTFIKWNTSTYPATVDIVSDVAVTFNRRDYRIFNEYSQLYVDASTINGDFPANNDTKYQLWLYDGAAVVYTGDWNAGAALLDMTLAKIVRYLDGLPSTLKMAVNTKHTYSSVDYEALQVVLWEASVQSGIYDDDFYLGVLSPSTASNIWTAPQTGTYAFTVSANLLGDVEARINGGSWVQVIAAGNPTGNLVGVTASDTIETQHLDSSSSDEVLLTIAAPSGTEDAFGVVIFA